ncbi:adenylyltransferase/cytidyltransferase family protein [[Clostridium] innocuum]|nr:adenylyltransferase/cytidyltransferase family protein [[Clostridium] innocuum]
MKPYKIGYTTGVFDMFHIGHLNILEKAKEQCEILIVGVSTDEVVREYKNKVPIIPYNQRARIVSALKCVDKVVPQENMNKFDAWKVIGFNVLFHGDDWKGSKMYDEIEKQFAEVGVDLIFLKHTSGISSTILREKING